MDLYFLQDTGHRPSPATEAMKWQAAAGALGLVQTLRSRGYSDIEGGYSVIVLGMVVEALQTADSQSLLPLLACLRQVSHMIADFMRKFTLQGR